MDVKLGDTVVEKRLIGEAYIALSTSDQDPDDKDFFPVKFLQQPAYDHSQSGAHETQYSILGWAAIFKK